MHPGDATRGNSTAVISLVVVQNVTDKPKPRVKLPPFPPPREKLRLLQGPHRASFSPGTPLGLPDLRR